MPTYCGTSAPYYNNVLCLSLVISINMEYITRNCLHCSGTFRTQKRYLKRGGAKFCSRTCFGKFNIKPKQPNVTCAKCSKSFYRQPARLKSKSSLYFCSRKCKDSAQKINGGIRSIMPKHYGTSLTDYRKISIRITGYKCVRCGYDNPNAIVVHHKDRNRKNNDPKNLETLCANCHMIEHKQ